MRTAVRLLLFATLALGVGTAQAWDLRVRGLVTEYLGGTPITNATIRVYKDGVVQYNEPSGSFGRYAFTLDNNARYILRFSAPGHQTKCFSVDTHGLARNAEKGTKDVFVEMTLFQKVQGLDLSYFDLPMGIARFEPWTGLLTWDQDYDGRIRPEVRAIMDEYERRTMPMPTTTAEAMLPGREGLLRR
ncbi:MAG: carboxypeptidase-like regulatory domain-containing protein [Flavobacteriales bacterium]